MELLSEQEIIDCGLGFGLYGCTGGAVEDVYTYAMEKGISNEYFYPYVGKVNLF